MFGAVAVALVATSLVACAPGFDMVRTDPGLYPVFQYSVTDYVNRCDPNQPTEVSVSAPDGTTVSVSGQPARGGNFTAQVAQQFNERFEIVVSRPDGMSTHHVRCLPSEFPQWGAARSGTPQADYYATMLIDRSAMARNWPVIFDTNGVPVWWTQRGAQLLLTSLGNGNLGTTGGFGTLTERRLDGSVVRTLDTVGAPSDFHDAILLPGGDYAMVTLDARPCDLREWGLAESSTCLFHTVQVLTPDGDLVWSWQAESDIPVTETAGVWRGTDAQGRADPWHWNSIEWTGDGFLLSFRHTNAVYKVSYPGGDVVWKLGGSARAESLAVVGDPAGSSIFGQHDARLLPGGVVSLFDNGFPTGRAPRSVTYRVDEDAMTATFLNAVTDSIAPQARCCGSFRQLPGGNFVTGWGSTRWVTENEPDGSQVFRLDVGFVYRGTPLSDETFSREALRAGMDAQYTDGVFAHPRAQATAGEALDPAELAARLGLPE